MRTQNTSQWRKQQAAQKLNKKITSKRSRSYPKQNEIKETLTSPELDASEVVTKLTVAEIRAWVNAAETVEAVDCMVVTVPET